MVYFSRLKGDAHQLEAHANAEDVFALVSQKLPTLTKRARVTDNKNKPDQCGFRAISFSISASVRAR
jgi:hypothetical protein